MIFMFSPIKLSSACEIWGSQSIEYYVLSLLVRAGPTASIVRANDYSSVLKQQVPAKFTKLLASYSRRLILVISIDQKLSVKFQKIQMI